MLSWPLYTEQPKLEIRTAGPTAALLTAREDFDLQCTVRNNGLVPIEPIHEASLAINRIKLRRGRTTQPLKRLNPGEETTYSWSIRSFSRESVARASVVLRCQMPTGEIRQAVDQNIILLPAIPRISNQTTSDLRTYDQNGHVITENRHLRTLFVRGNSGFEYCLLFAAKNGRYRQVAVCNAISEIRYCDTSGTLDTLKSLRLSTDSPEITLANQLFYCPLRNEAKTVCFGLMKRAFRCLRTPNEPR